MTDETTRAARCVVPEPLACRALAAELHDLIKQATPEDLSDKGTYFGETFADLTQCRHGETGRYEHPNDGPLVEWLWNRRYQIAALYEAQATADTSKG